MKTKIVPFFLYAFCIAFLNFTFSDEFEEYGISQKDIQNRLWNGLQAPSVNVPYFGSSVKSACRSLAPETQATAIKKAGAFVKTYFNSEDFQKRYTESIAKKYPKLETTVSEQRKAEIRAGRLKGVQGLQAKDMEPVVDIQIQSAETFVGMESMLSSIPAEQRADFKKQIDDGKRNAAFFKKIKPLLKTNMEEFKKQYAEYLANDEIRQSEETLTRNAKSNADEYEKLKDPKKVLTARLTDFLNQSKGVDFAAQTKEVNGRKKFVNGAYEAKSDVWKFCYRMGATPTNTARAFAQQWLAELK
ncbi:hypothetical protein SAMN05216327_108194 [Dyadobacter sp. SG02]|uniref:hypothetical protein n=1 Tax=Dyadobacter sp. SG02 TaxID=1855291 RepID=UPI0008C44551|nr:hypothetical protein [Dyadobacter sp. SG02]SEJ30940.1 hypothetical protein SAMN05216327_108194 [Dyadobacter sp. SG02]